MKIHAYCSIVSYPQYSGNYRHYEKLKIYFSRNCLNTEKKILLKILPIAYTWEKDEMFSLCQKFGRNNFHRCIHLFVMHLCYQHYYYDINIIIMLQKQHGITGKYQKIVIHHNLYFDRKFLSY